MLFACVINYYYKRITNCKNPAIILSCCGYHATNVYGENANRCPLKIHEIVSRTTYGQRILAKGRIAGGAPTPPKTIPFPVGIRGSIYNTWFLDSP